MPFKKKELEKYRELLLEKKAEIQAFLDEGKVVSREEQEILPDTIDQATSTSERLLHLRLLDKQTKLLREIDRALERIEEGTFGFCEGTGEEIDHKRLELRPWARFSAEYKSEIEKRERNRKYMR